MATCATVNESGADCVEPTNCGCCYEPSVDIIEREDELTVLADLPGVKREDINIDFENGVLSLSGTVTAREPEGVNILAREYGVGDFHRSFRIGKAIDASRISAEVSNGVLTLHLPKEEGARVRKIEVKAN